MTTKLTARLDEIKKVIDAATPGKWVIDRIPGAGNLSVICFRHGVWYEVTEHGEDRELIAQSRTFAPQLVEALRVAIDEIQSSPCWMEEIQTTSAVRHDNACPRCEALKEIESILCPAPKGEGK